jgi:transcriptional regulator with XRE-family HTH domain
MVDLRKRFGRLVAAHRRRVGLTQEALADAADLSVDMISKIEVGASGARFPVIERLASVLKVDPAEFFTTEIPSGAVRRKAFNELSLRLVDLSESDLAWISGLLDAALRPRRSENPTGGNVAQAASATATPRRDNKGTRKVPKAP